MSGGGSVMSAHAILAVKGLRSRGADRQRLADVAKLGNEGWSLYGAPWLQPVAVNGKPAERRSGENKPNPLRSVATGCLRRSMVRRGSTVRVRQRALQTAATSLPATFHGKQGVCRDLPPVAGGPLPAKEGVDTYS